MKVASEINTVELTIPNDYEENTAETVYTASDRRDGEPIQTAESKMLQRQTMLWQGGCCGFINADYSILSQNEVTPRKSLQMSSPYLTHTADNTMLITRLKFNYDGGLRCETEGCGL